MGDAVFAGMPSINIPRSRWDDGHTHTTSIRHGFFTPLECIPVVAGDTIHYKFKSLVRMQTPIAPIFGNIDISYVAFFVPLRLVWEHAEEFFGANKTSAGYQQNTYTLPAAQFYNVDAGSLSHYLGKPIALGTDLDGSGRSYWANITKERGYYLIWNEFARAQQITNPVIVNFTDSLKTTPIANKIGSWNGANINTGDAYGGSLMRVAKKFDNFTSCTISPQYGAAVELPLGTTAPIKFEAASALTANTNYAVGFEGNGTKYYNLTSSGVANEDGWASSVNGSLFADLSQATAAKINDIRFAFACQKFLERSNFAGSTMWGQLQVHYGVTSPDARLQRPEFLGQMTHPINVHQVVATADTTNSGIKTSVGNTGAVSVTASGEVSLFNKSFVEPGYVYILAFTKHRRLYSQGLMKEDRKLDRMEIYTPEMANLGDDAVKTTEIYWKANETDIFGYNMHWYEYHYRPDRVSGMIDPYGNNSLSFWTLAEKFTTKPQLNDDFIFEDRTELDRALTTGSTFDEYVIDLWSSKSNVRPKIYNIFIKS